MADALLMSCRGLLRRLEVEAGRNEPRGLFCNGPRVTKLHTVIPTGRVEFLLDHVEV